MCRINSSKPARKCLCKALHYERLGITNDPAIWQTSDCMMTVEKLFCWKPEHHTLMNNWLCWHHGDKKAPRRVQYVLCLTLRQPATSKTDVFVNGPSRMLPPRWSVCSGCAWGHPCIGTIEKRGREACHSPQRRTSSYLNTSRAAFSSLYAQHPQRLSKNHWI